MNELIKVSNMSKNYKHVTALDNVSLTFHSKTFYAIMGPSGSGKTTLINMLGFLDQPTNGEIYYMGQPTKELTHEKAAQIRNKDIGFVFQSFYLLSHLTAVENVMLPMYLDETIAIKEMEVKAKKLLAHLGLEDRVTHYPRELSAGEQQRVAIARALANDPKIIIADEPTGNLDEETEKNILEILKKLSLEGKTIITVSHNPIIKAYSDIVIKINKGKVGIGE